MSRRNRPERAETLMAAEARLAAGRTQRQVAAELGVARGTLQDWRAGSADAVLGALAALVATSEGVHWLAAHGLGGAICDHPRGGAGVRVVCEFLELSGLSAFVGSSYGSQQALNAALEAALVAVATEQCVDQGFALEQLVPIGIVEVGRDECGSCAVAQIR